MVTPRRGYAFELEPEPANLLFELLESVDRKDEPEIKGAIQKPIAEKLRMEVLNIIGARYYGSVYGDYVLKASDSIEKKVFKEETTRAIKKFSEFSKQIDAAVAEWQRQLKGGGGDQKVQRKGKLDEIEEKAEENP